MLLCGYLIICFKIQWYFLKKSDVLYKQIGASGVYHRENEQLL